MKTNLITLILAAALILPASAYAADRSLQIQIYELRIQTHMEKKAQQAAICLSAFGPKCAAAMAATLQPQNGVRAFDTLAPPLTGDEEKEVRDYVMSNETLIRRQAGEAAPTEEEYEAAKK
jgi:hypothetical protein